MDAFIVVCILLVVAGLAWPIYSAVKKNRASTTATATATVTSAATGSGTGTGAAAAGTTTPPTPSTPTAPATVSRGFSYWIWPVIIVLTLLVGWYALSALRKSTPTPAPQRATAPGRTLTEKYLRVPLRVVGGKDTPLDSPKGVVAEFEFDNSPIQGIKVVRYQIGFSGRMSGECPKSTLKLQASRKYITSETTRLASRKKLSSSENIPAEEGYWLNPDSFRPGKARVRLWSDDGVRILNSHVQAIYMG